MHMNYLKSEHNVSSIDEYLGKPYVFNMFENFEECSRLYKSEKNVLSKLMEVRSTLLQLQKDLFHEVLNLQAKSMYENHACFSTSVYFILESGFFG